MPQFPSDSPWSIITNTIITILIIVPTISEHPDRLYVGHLCAILPQTVVNNYLENIHKTHAKMKLLEAASLLGFVLRSVLASSIGASSLNVTYGRVETDANGDVISSVVLEYVGDNPVESRSIECRSTVSSVQPACSFDGRRLQYSYAHYSKAPFLIAGQKADCCTGLEQGTSICHNRLKGTKLQLHTSSPP